RGAAVLGDLQGDAGVELPHRAADAAEEDSAAAGLGLGGFRSIVEARGADHRPGDFAGEDLELAMDDGVERMPVGDGHPIGQDPTAVGGFENGFDEKSSLKASLLGAEVPLRADLEP